MKKFNKKHIIILSLITLLFLTLAAFSFKTGNNAFSNAVGTVVSPIQKGFSAIVNGTGRVIGNVASSGKNAKENEKLKKEISELKSELRMLDGYKAENERLRAFIDLKETRTDFECVGANVIGKKTGELKSVITLDKGKKHGVRKNSVVFVPEGLVGIVTEVGVNFCKVRTIFDAESSVSGICLRTGDMGIVEPSGGKCAMNYLDRSAKTVVGDIIETSGTGGLFPRGIVIGKISEIKEDSRNLTLSAVIEAGVNVYKLDSVLVSVK